jgi:hypothetical protein
MGQFLGHYFPQNFTWAFKKYPNWQKCAESGHPGPSILVHQDFKVLNQDINSHFIGSCYAIIPYIIIT